MGYIGDIFPFHDRDSPQELRSEVGMALAEGMLKQKQSEIKASSTNTYCRQWNEIMR
jgi:hypothetical protein